MIGSLILAALLAAPARAMEPVAVSLSKLKDVTLQLYGFLETDLITDSRQGFAESQANSLVPKDNAGGQPNFAGRHYRTQMSVRQSRFGMDLGLPQADGWKADGIVEIDFYGNDAPNTLPGATAGAQSERDFFDNPAARIRHAYINATNGGWNLKAGQYWSLFGWQTEYFPPEITVQATVGQLNDRLPQLRATYAEPLAAGLSLQGAAAVARPNQMNSGSPVYQAATRLSSSRWRTGVNGGYASPVKDASVGVSFEAVPFQTAGFGDPTATALAFDAVVPIIPSKDGKSGADTLAFIGEIVTGEGIGGVEMPLLTFGVAGPTAAQVGTAIDAGLAGVDTTGNIQPIRFRSFRGALSYVFPDPKWGAGAGYAQVEGRNLDRFSTAAAAASIAPKLQYGFADVVYAPLDWLRLGAQFSQTRDTYNDASSRFAINNRLQLTSFFVF